MSVLAQVSQSVESHARFVEQQVARARSDPEFREQILQRWRTIGAGVGKVTTPTGLPLPRWALPLSDEPGEIARYLYGEGLPGEFPFINAAYPEMYLEKSASQNSTSQTSSSSTKATSPAPPPLWRRSGSVSR